MCKGFQQNERDRLKIKSFYTQLSVSCSKNKSTLPECLTLHFLPRINGALLEVNGSNIRPDSPAFMTLYRDLSGESNKGVVYGCRENAILCEGVRFEIYVGELKVLKGSFRKNDGRNWKMECKIGDDIVEGVKFAEVLVETMFRGVMSHKVEIPARRRVRRRSGGLEEIPEESEEEEESSVCCCSECSGEEEMDGEDEGREVEVEMEGVRWAVDVGFWVVCIGVGVLVSASSTKRLRRKLFV